MLCPYCGQTFFSYKGINKHIPAFHPMEFQFICLCGQTFKFRKGLNIHMRQCPKNVSNVEHPEIVKSPDAKYKCECMFCHQRFQRNAYLQQHLKLYHKTEDHHGTISIPTRD